MKEYDHDDWHDTERYAVISARDTIVCRRKTLDNAIKHARRVAILYGGVSRIITPAGNTVHVRTLPGILRAGLEMGRR